MKATHEHEFEAQLGLPEKLPKGEHILWQGAPDWWGLGVHAFHLRSLSLYFALMLALQASYLSEQGGDWSMKPMIITGTLIAVTLASLAAWAYMSAKASMYTITNKRVVMRIGVVFSVTFNLPLQQIVSAQELIKGDHCDISLTLKASDRIAWLHLWPHARPWVLKHPEPTLRCLRQGRQCADVLKSAWLDINAVNSDNAHTSAAASPSQAASNSPQTATSRDRLGFNSMPHTA